MKIILGLLAAVCIFAGTGCHSAPGNLDKISMAYNGDVRKYAVYKPANYDPKASWPAVLFLHGLFEGGSDGEAMTKVGIGPAIADHPDWYRCIVIFAQTPGSWRDDDQLPLAMATLDDAQKHYNIDSNRIVLSGLSTGGGAVWKLGARYPQRWAALAPLCAYGDLDDVKRLTHVPIWAFHNSLDPFVSSGSTDKMCEQINAAGGNARKTIFNAIGHDCWDSAYNMQQFADWLQNQHR